MPLPDTHAPPRGFSPAPGTLQVNTARQRREQVGNGQEAEHCLRDSLTFRTPVLKTQKCSRNVLVSVEQLHKQIPKTNIIHYCGIILSDYYILMHTYYKDYFLQCLFIFIK